MQAETSAGAASILTAWTSSPETMVAMVTRSFSQPLPAAADQAVEAARADSLHLGTPLLTTLPRRDALIAATPLRSRLLKVV